MKTLKNIVSQSIETVHTKRETSLKSVGKRLHHGTPEPWVTINLSTEKALSGIAEQKPISLGMAT